MWFQLTAITVPKPIDVVPEKSPMFLSVFLYSVNQPPFEAT